MNHRIPPTPLFPPATVQTKPTITDDGNPLLVVNELTAENQWCLPLMVDVPWRQLIEEVGILF